MGRDGRLGLRVFATVGDGRRDHVRRRTGIRRRGQAAQVPRARALQRQQLALPRVRAFGNLVQRAGDVRVRAGRRGRIEEGRRFSDGLQATMHEARGGDVKPGNTKISAGLVRVDPLEVEREQGQRAADGAPVQLAQCARAQLAEGVEQELLGALGTCRTAAPGPRRFPPEPQPALSLVLDGPRVGILSVGILSVGSLHPNIVGSQKRRAAIGWLHREQLLVHEG